MSRQHTLLVVVVAAAAIITMVVVILLPERPRGLDAQAEQLAVRLDALLARTEHDDTLIRLGLLPLSLPPGAGEEVSFLAEAIAEQIAEQLKHHRRLTLIGHRSARVVVDAGLAKPIVARLLDADYLLHGDVTLDDGSVVVTLRLWQGRTATQEWQLQSRGTAQSLQELPLRVTHRIEDTLLQGASLREARTAPETMDGEVHRRYLRALYLTRRANVVDIRRAIDILDELLTSQPGEARLVTARLGALLSLNSITGNHVAEISESIAELERDLLQHAGEDPGLLGIRARAAAWYNDLGGALALVHRAVSADPQHAGNVALAADLSLAAGYLVSATRHATQAARLEPVAAVSHERLALVYGIQGHDEAMREHAEIAAELGLATTGYYLGFAALRSGRVSIGIGHLHEALEAAGGPTAWLEALASALQDPRQRDEALTAMDLADADARGFLDEFFIYYALLGDTQRALTALHALSRSGYGQWTQLLWMPELDTVRADPGFADWLAATTLPEIWQLHGAPDLCVRTGEGFDCSRPRLISRN